MKSPTRSQYPKGFWVNGEYYKLHFAKLISRDSSILGLCDPTSRRITIKLGMKPDKTLRTVLHELLHALEFEWEIDINHKLIHKLEGPLLRFLIDNF